VGYLHFCNLLFIQMQGGLSSFLQSFVHSNKEWYFVNLALISSWFTQDQMLCFLYHHTNHNFSLGIIKTISFLTFLERFFIHWFFIRVFFIPVLETISITTRNWTYYRFFRSQRAGNYERAFYSILFYSQTPLHSRNHPNALITKAPSSNWN